MLRATAVCHFSTSQLPKVLRRRSVLYIFTWNVLRATGACHFSCLFWSYLRTRRFSEPTFRPSRHTNPRKNTAFRDFPNISPRCIFFLLAFAQLYLILSSGSTSPLLFIFWLCFSALHLISTVHFELSEVRLLNFLWSVYSVLHRTTPYYTAQCAETPWRCKTHCNCDIHDSICWALKGPVQCAEQFLELKICVSLQFRAIDTPNPARGFIQQNQNARLPYSGVQSNISKCTFCYSGLRKNV